MTGKVHATPKPMDDTEASGRVVILIQGTSPEEWTRIVEELLVAPSFVLPLFVAQTEEADRLQALFAHRKDVVLQRASTAEEVRALLATFRQQDSPSRRHFSWSRGLLGLTLAVSSIQDQGSLLEALLQQAMAATPATGGCVWLWDDEAGRLEQKVCAGQVCDEETATEADLAQRVLQGGQAALLTRAPHAALSGYTRGSSQQAAPLAVETSPGAGREILAVPMVAANRTLGVVVLDSDAASASFTDDHFEAVSVMASQVAMNLEGARLFSRVEQGKKEWEATFDAIGDSVLLIGPDRRILRANRATARNSGLQFADIVGQPCCKIVHGCDSPPERCPLTEVARARGPASAEIADRDGSRILNVSAYPIFDARGEVQSVVEHIRDVTHIKQAQSRLMQAEKLSALGELVAGVAHELNNPLTSILGFAQLLQRSDLPEQQRGYLDTIYDESKRASRIVRNLLTFAHRQEPEKRMLDLNEILDETLTLMAYQLRVSSIRVERSFDSRLPKTAADPYQLQQVFVNLINNAQQAMQEAHGAGRLTLRTMTVKRPAGYDQNSSLNGLLTTDDTQETWIRLEFADDGPGIPLHLQARIFDPFFTTKTQGKGTGLGLSVCHGIVRDHEGHVWVESTPGRGATFVIELPVRSVHTTQAETSESRRLPNLPPGRALVVDDEEANLHLLRELLGRHGQIVDIAKDGSEALEKLAKNRYDIVLCDLRMPGLSGNDLFGEATQRWPGIQDRWVFFTGDIASPRTRAFLDEAGRPVIEKPFEVATLLRVLGQVYRSTER